MDQDLKASYFETKTRMLEIVQESLRIKLEVNSIKEAFLNVLQTHDAFESSRRLPVIKTSVDGNSTSARTKVRAVYDARRARLKARKASRREKENTDPALLINGDEKAARLTMPQKKCCCAAAAAAGRLTPISEERQPTTVNNNFDIFSNVNHLINNNIINATTTTTTPGKEKNYYSDGEYVQLKQPPTVLLQSKIRTTPTKKDFDYVNIRTENADGADENTSLWNRSISPSRSKYASSGAINQMYMSSPNNIPSLHDISDISRSSTDRNLQLYQLHSTLNYPLHSTLKSEDVDSVNAPITTTSNSTNTGSGSSSKVEETTVKTLDKAAIRSDSFSGSSTSRSSSSGSAAPGLCKEHGLHPSFGGPCIFKQTIQPIRAYNSDADDERELDKKRPHLVATDYDSSYLSECQETDDMQNIDYEDYIHVYDSVTGRMRIMKRQTGQTSLGHPRSRIGLSESDLFESTKASRSSVNATKDSKDVQRPLSIATTTTNTTNTSNTDSPESNQSPIAPVNSPNVTDSGSSSRPTTDSYEYFDLPQQRASSFNSIPQIARKILNYDKINGNFYNNNPSITTKRSIKRDEHGQFRVPEIPQLRNNNNNNVNNNLLHNRKTSRRGGGDDDSTKSPLPSHHHHHPAPTTTTTTSSVKQIGDHIYFYDKHGSPKTILKQTSTSRLPKRKKREIRKRLELFTANFQQQRSNIKVLGQV